MDRETVVSDPEFPATAKVRRDLCTVNNVLAWKAGDVRARSADVLAIDDCHPLSFCSKGPGGDSRTGPATKNHQIEFFWLHVVKYLGGRNIESALHTDSFVDERIDARHRFISPAPLRSSASCAALA